MVPTEKFDALQGSADPKLSVVPDSAGDAQIASLMEQAESQQGEAREFMTPKTGGKRPGSGRKRKNPDDPKWAKKDAAKEEPGTESPPPGIDTKQAMRGVFTVASGVIVRYTTVPETALTPDEIASLGDAWGEVINRRLPAMMASYGDIIVALMVTGGVVMRLSAVVENEIEKRRAAAAKEVQAEQEARAA